MLNSLAVNYHRETVLLCRILTVIVRLFLLLCLKHFSQMKKKTSLSVGCEAGDRAVGGTPGTLLLRSSTRQGKITLLDTAPKSRRL